VSSVLQKSLQTTSMHPERSALGCRLAYLEVGKGCESWMAEALKTKRHPA